MAIHCFLVLGDLRHSRSLGRGPKEQPSLRRLLHAEMQSRSALFDHDFADLEYRREAVLGEWWAWEAQLSAVRVEIAR